MKVFANGTHQSLVESDKLLIAKANTGVSAVALTGKRVTDRKMIGVYLTQEEVDKIAEYRTQEPATIGVGERGCEVLVTHNIVPADRKVKSVEIGPGGGIRVNYV